MTTSSVSRPPNRRGVTLLELLLVFAVIAVATAVAGVSVRPPLAIDEPDSAMARIEALRIKAVATGSPTTEFVRSDSGVAAVTAYPDSRVLSDVSLSLDPLSGRRNVTR